MKKAEIAIIGGTGTEAISKSVDEPLRIGTPYGLAPPIFLGELGKRTVAFQPRHGVNHDLPPHKVNYRANIYALHSLRVTRIIATSAVGAINLEFRPGDLVIPHDFVDFTKQRPFTFFDTAPVTHIDMCEPYCPEIRQALIKAAKLKHLEAHNRAVFVSTEGPRFETPAEIQVFRRLGCDIVGMTGVPEATLARELGICYAPVCLVTNMAAGLQKHLASVEHVEAARKMAPSLEQLLSEALIHLPEKRQCQCRQVLEGARLG